MFLARSSRRCPAAAGEHCTAAPTLPAVRARCSQHCISADAGFLRLINRRAAATAAASKPLAAHSGTAADSSMLTRLGHPSPAAVSLSACFPPTAMLPLLCTTPRVPLGQLRPILETYSLGQLAATRGLAGVAAAGSADSSSSRARRSRARTARQPTDAAKPPVDTLPAAPASAAPASAAASKARRTRSSKATAAAAPPPPKAATAGCSNVATEARQLLQQLQQYCSAYCAGKPLVRALAQCWLAVLNARLLLVCSVCACVWRIQQQHPQQTQGWATSTSTCLPVGVTATWSLLLKLRTRVALSPPPFRLPALLHLAVPSPNTLPPRLAATRRPAPTPCRHALLHPSPPPPAHPPPHPPPPTYRCLMACMTQSCPALHPCWTH